MNGIRVDLTNTPGVYYVIGYFLSSCLYIRMNPRRYKGLKLWGIQGAFLLVLGFFMIFTDNINRAFYFPCVAVEIFLLWLSIYVLQNGLEKGAVFLHQGFSFGRICRLLRVAAFLFRADQLAPYA